MRINNPKNIFLLSQSALSFIWLTLILGIILAPIFKTLQGMRYIHILKHNIAVQCIVLIWYIYIASYYVDFFIVQDSYWILYLWCTRLFKIFLKSSLVCQKISHKIFYTGLVYAKDCILLEVCEGSFCFQLLHYKVFTDNHDTDRQCHHSCDNQSMDIVCSDLSYYFYYVNLS